MKKTKKNCDLTHCMLCKLCLNDWLPAVDAHRENYHIQKGEILFAEGDPVKGMYFVYDGSVKVHKKWDDEKELIIRIAGKGDIVGHRGLGKELFYPVSATALESTNVCYLPLDFFMSSLKVNHDFLFQLMLFFAAELKESEKNMHNLAHMPAKGRMALVLLNLQAKFGVDPKGAITLKLSRQDLASMTGTTYETVFRLLNELKEDDLIRIEGKDITVLDEKKLRALTEPG